MPDSIRDQLTRLHAATGKVCRSWMGLDNDSERTTVSLIPTGKFTVNNGVVCIDVWLKFDGEQRWSKDTWYLRDWGLKPIEE